MVKLGVLVSGSGSNLQAIIDNIENDSVSAEIVLVISDQADAYALERARKHGIPAVSLSWKKFPTREAYDAALAAELKRRNVELVCLAGFMRVLKGEFLKAFEGRIVNIHPSLLPSFPGLEAWKQALEYGVKVTGCTVHFVDAGVDSGPIIGQQSVPVLDDDTPATLHQRVHQAEHELYPRCVAAIARREIKVEGRRIVRKP